MTFTRVRDCLFLVTGLGGLIYQQVTQSYNATLVGAYLSLLLTPGALGVATLVRSARTNGGEHGQSPPSGPQDSPSPPPLSTSVSRDGGEP